MPITSSAKRALRQSARRRVYNVRRSRAMKDAINAVVETVSSSKGGEEALRLAYKAIDKAEKRGIIKKNTAARKKSRIARLLNPKKK